MYTIKLSQIIDEFCLNGDLENYRDIIQVLFQNIQSNNCKISARYDSEISSHFNGIIRISLLTIYDKPQHIIWNILHEYGHFLSRAIDKKDENNLEIRIKSEEKAWEYAYQNILEYPKLTEHIEDFQLYKKKCLDSYYRMR